MVMSRFWTLLFLVAACLLSFVGSESDIKGSDPINSCFCQLEGVLEDCPCEAATVDNFNQKLRLQLSPLLHHPYFRYFQVCLIIPSAGANSYSFFPGRFLPALRLLVWGWWPMYESRMFCWNLRWSRTSPPASRRSSTLSSTTAGHLCLHLKPPELACP